MKTTLLLFKCFIIYIGDGVKDASINATFDEFLSELLLKLSYVHCYKQYKFVFTILIHNPNSFFMSFIYIYIRYNVRRNFFNFVRLVYSRYDTIAS